VRLYRILITLAAPFLLGLLLWRWLGRRESLADLTQRLGGGEGAPGAIWLHGASNGELTSARRLIEALLDVFPDRALVITANTTTARDMVRGWGLARVSARLAPLDLRPVLARFRARWRPAALVVLENELWPNRIATMDGPVLAVSARMSDRSAARWARRPGVMGAMLARIDWLAPQDDASGQRFVQLGLEPARLGPVTRFKQAVSLPSPTVEELGELAVFFDRHDTVLAASTHAGEEAEVLRGFAQARAARPGLRLILAPRHPRRAEEVAGLIRAEGLELATRSGGARPDAPVYLADTLGEMALWYALAGATFVGGSLVERGGHTPFEPIQAGSAVLHGPHVANFAEAYGALDAGQAALPVVDGAGLARALIELAEPGAAQQQTDRATRIATELGAGGDGIAQILAALRDRIGA